MADSSEFDLLAGMKRSVRVYARVIANTERRMSRSPRTPTERRILLALNSLHKPVDAELAAYLGMDGAQLSRAVENLIVEGLVGFEPASKHRSQRFLSLTSDGSKVAADLDVKYEVALEAEFHRLGRSDQSHLLEGACGPADRDAGDGADDALGLRAPRLEDCGWLLDQMIGYGRDFGWSGAHAAKSAAVIESFLLQPFFDRQLGWIAQRFGMPVGACLMLVSDPHATIGALFVIPGARGRGVGGALLAAAIEKAKELTFVSLTAEASERQPNLDRIYRKLGFTRSKSKDQDHRFGPLEDWRTYRFSLPLQRSARITT